MTNYQKFKKDSCEGCGFVPEDACQLAVHHLDHNHLNDDPANLQTLCANCHALCHRGAPSTPSSRYVKCPFCKERLGLTYSLHRWVAEHLSESKHCRVLAEYEAEEKLARMRHKHERSIERGKSNVKTDDHIARWGPWFVAVLYAELLGAPRPEMFRAE